MAKVTGFQRYQITRVWLMKHRDMDKELFIKKVCESKGLEYVPPVKVDRNVLPKVNQSPMFPTE